MAWGEEDGQYSFCVFFFDVPFGSHGDIGLDHGDSFCGVEIEVLVGEGEFSCSACEPCSEGREEQNQGSFFCKNDEVIFG